jgi:hypothetical protein
MSDSDLTLAYRRRNGHCVGVGWDGRSRALSPLCALVALALFAGAGCSSSSSRGASTGPTTTAPRATAPIASAPGEPTRRADAPLVLLSCPTSTIASAGTWQVSFGHHEVAGSARIVRYDIDYGDGHTYSNDSAARVFEHRYTVTGQFLAKVRVTDAANRSASASRSCHVPSVSKPTAKKPRYTGNGTEDG